MGKLIMEHEQLCCCCFSFAFVYVFLVKVTINNTQCEATLLSVCLCINECICARQFARMMGTFKP